MSSPLRMVVTFLLVAIAVTWVCGLGIGFPGFSVSPRSFIQHPKRSSCPGNPCNYSTPFLCAENQFCIRLDRVCDDMWDCDNGSDEDPYLCTAARRPPEDVIREFLEQQREWILPQLFNDKDPALVAYVLTLAHTMGDLQSTLDLTPQNRENIYNATETVIEGDERFLLTLGMPSRAWPEVKYLLETLLEGGLNVWVD